MVMPISTRIEHKSYKQLPMGEAKFPALSTIAGALLEAGIKLEPKHQRISSLRELVKCTKLCEKRITGIVAASCQRPILQPSDLKDASIFYSKVLGTQDETILIARGDKQSMILICELRDLVPAEDFSLSRCEFLPIYFVTPSVYKRLLRKTTHTLHSGMDSPINVSANTPRLARQLTDELQNLGGSDLHITPNETYYRVAIRIHGILRPMILLSNKTGLELTNHWKVLANLDLTQKRRPQDGSILNMQDGDASFRVNTCPTLFGERVVIRLHATSAKAIPISELGMNTDQQKIFSRALSETSGLVLIAGPTGSGKTNTVYAGLQYLTQQALHIISIEDPVEVNLPHVTQINTTEVFPFSDALRTVVRQDPDVLFIGEIRDRDTAEIALAASQTGHLVLATIHAGDSCEAICRMQNLGVDSGALMKQLRLVVSQRLVRILTEKKRLSQKQIDQAYTRREGIFEFFSINKNKQSLYSDALKKNELQKYCAGSTSEMFADQILGLIEAGKCDWSEIQRVFGWGAVSELSSREC